MADMLVTMLAVLALLTVAGWRVDWLASRWIVVGAGGAFLPDLSRVSLLVEDATLEAILGMPFEYTALETLGGVVLVAGAITVWFERQYWRRVYGLLVAGGSIHLVLDGLRIYADGRASQWLFPFVPAYRPPTPGLFVSADPAVPALAVGATAVVLAVDRWIVADSVWRAQRGANKGTAK